MKAANIFIAKFICLCSDKIPVILEGVGSIIQWQNKISLKANCITHNKPLYPIIAVNEICLIASLLFSSD
jgi:hypothetical protein